MVLFRFMSNYFAHKAAWSLVEEMRVRSMTRSRPPPQLFHDKQTGDLMSRVVNDTATLSFVRPCIPDMMTSVITVVASLQSSLA